MSKKNQKPINNTILVTVLIVSAFIILMSKTLLERNRNKELNDQIHRDQAISSITPTPSELPTPSLAPNSNIFWIKYSDPEFQISLNHPSNWKTREKFFESVSDRLIKSVYFEISNQRSPFKNPLSIGLWKGTIETNKKLLLEREAIDKSFKSMDGTFKGRRSFTVNVYDMDGSINNAAPINYKVTLLLVSLGNNTLIITSPVLQKDINYDFSSKEVGEVINSIKFQ